MLTRIPIRWRLTAYFTLTTLAIVVLLLLTATAIYAIQLESMINETVESRAGDAVTLAEDRGGLTDGDLAPLAGGGVEVVAMDANGTVVAQAGSGLEPGEPIDHPLWEEALRSDMEASLSRGENLPAGLGFAIAVPVEIEGSEIRVIEARQDYSFFTEQWLWVPVVSVVVILALLLASLGGYFLVRSALRPVTELSESAERITARDLSQRLPVTTYDELGRLARTINELLARLELSFAEREAALEQQRRFAADASHELRTPLTSVLGYARMLRQWGLDDPTITREGVTAMEREAERMQALIERLLELARGDQGAALALRETDLEPVVREAVERSGAEEARPGLVTITTPDEPVIGMVDPDGVEQVLLILLDNALKYTDDDTRIAIALEADAAAKRAVVTVRDWGPGIPQAQTANVFDRFYRAGSERTSEGFGLGLSIAKLIVDQHGGEIALTSESGEGATFRVELPLVGEGRPRFSL